MAKKKGSTTERVLHQAKNLSKTISPDVSVLESTKVVYKQNIANQFGAADTVTSLQLTWAQLIKDEQTDSELKSIAQRAGSEQEVEHDPVCYFKKDMTFWFAIGGPQMFLLLIPGKQHAKLLSLKIAGKRWWN